MHIVIESGLMYSVSVVVFFVLYFASNNAQYGVSDCVSLPGVIQSCRGCLHVLIKRSLSDRPDYRSLYLRDILGTLLTPARCLYCRASRST